MNDGAIVTPAPRPEISGPNDAALVCLEVGEPAPYVVQRTADTERFNLSSAAGRYLVLGFVGSVNDDLSRGVIAALERQKTAFQPDHAAFFGISIDPKDEAEGRWPSVAPAFRCFWDFDLTVSRAYGACPKTGPIEYRRFWLVTDPTLRVIQKRPMTGPDGGVEDLVRWLRSLPPPLSFAGFEVHAPVLVLPNVFEAALCQRLIDDYEREDRAITGVMRLVDGKTTGVLDSAFKVRRDHLLNDPDLMDIVRRRIAKRIAPEIKKVHQFSATRMERYLVGCYAAEDRAHFHPHRDNTTPGTAHRRFAVSINLSDDFDGGEVSFPEYGRRGFKLPAGGAVVFSCSLLHMVNPITRGRRYAFLPFLFDETAASLMAANRAKT